jgi:hypothetical protein
MHEEWDEMSGELEDTRAELWIEVNREFINSHLEEGKEGAWNMGDDPEKFLVYEDPPARLVKLEVGEECGNDEELNLSIWVNSPLCELMVNMRMTPAQISALVRSLGPEEQLEVIRGLGRDT